MLVLYFSGTGNSKYIAELLARNMDAACRSIEENTDFEALLKAEETIAFCYPVYASRVPRIMREFAALYSESLRGKKLIIFCTQMLFSGDGARAFAGLFPRKHARVIYAEHFIMPNNICNMFITPLASDGKVKKMLEKAERKMQKVCGNIKNNVIRKRGFNTFSRVLGLPQAVFLPQMEKLARRSVRIADNCTQCGICVNLCPVNNFSLQDNAIVHNHNCIVCYRCINECPQKAITVFFHGKVKKQYKGI